jgi:hypothetical protein
MKPDPEFFDFQWRKVQIQLDMAMQSPRWVGMADGDMRVIVGALLTVFAGAIATLKPAEGHDLEFITENLLNHLRKEIKDSRAILSNAREEGALPKREEALTPETLQKMWELS